MTAKYSYELISGLLVLARTEYRSYKDANPELLCDPLRYLAQCPRLIEQFSDSGSSSALDQMQRIWRKRCLQAKGEFDLAHLHRLGVESDQRPNSTTYREAVEKETAALDEYTRVLKLYTDLLVHGRIPPEIPPKAKGAGAGIVLAHVSTLVYPNAEDSRRVEMELERR